MSQYGSACPEDIGVASNIVVDGAYETALLAGHGCGHHRRAVYGDAYRAPLPRHRSALIGTGRADIRFAAGSSGSALAGMNTEMIPTSNHHHGRYGNGSGLVARRLREIGDRA